MNFIKPFTRLRGVTDRETRRRMWARLVLKQQAGRIARRVQPYSMVPPVGIEFLVRAVHRIIDNKVPGVFVECGVWQGGCAAAMMLAQNKKRPPTVPREIHLFDSFEGLPPAREEDGYEAMNWQEMEESDVKAWDNCIASIDTVRQNFNTLNMDLSLFHFHKGWFEETVPQTAAEHPDLKISLLRLDGDWYESTRICLETLYPMVAEGGMVIIDDYYRWEGCTWAVHEFLARHRLKHPLVTITHNQIGAYFIKQNEERIS